MALMFRIGISVSGVDENVQSLEGLKRRARLSPRPLLQQLGKIVHADILRNFQRKSAADGNKWAPQGQVTEKIAPGGSTGVDSGKLRESIRVRIVDGELRVGSNLEYAKLFAFGGRVSGKSAVPGAKVPARPFAVITEDTVRRIYDEVEAFYLGASS